MASTAVMLFLMVLSVPVRHAADRIEDRGCDRVTDTGVNHQAAGTARSVGAEYGQHHVGSGTDPPFSQGLAEVLLIPSQAETGGRIEQAADADGGVGHKTPERCQGLRPLQLEEAVVEGLHLSDVIEDVADPGLDKGRRDELIGVHHGEEDILVEAVVEFVHGPVEPFPWIINVEHSFIVAKLGDRVHGRLYRRAVGVRCGAA